MDPLTIALLAGTAIQGAGVGLNYFGAQQAQAAQPGLTFADTTASIDAKMAEAKKYGISPLAMLGVQPVQGAGINAFSDASNAASGISQNITRAALAGASQDTKLAGLQRQNLELQNAQLQNDVVAGQMKNSAQAIALSAAGSPPTSSAGMEGSPFAGPVNPFGGAHPTLQRNADGSVTRTKEQAEIAFSGDPVLMAQNAIDSIRRLMNDPSPSPSDIYRWLARPDVWRNVNPPVDPSTGVYGGQ